MNPVNIQRDGFWGQNDDASKVAFSSGKTITTGEYLTNGSGIVNKHIGFQTADISAATAHSAVTWKGIGTFMEPPLEEKIPYRIKARAEGMAGLPDKRFTIAIGYPRTPPITGTDDLCHEALYLPFVTEFDDVVLLDPLPTTSSEYGQPVNVSILVSDNTGTSTEVIVASLSVQNLGVAPPAFSQAVG